MPEAAVVGRIRLSRSLRPTVRDELQALLDDAAADAGLDRILEVSSEANSLELAEEIQIDSERLSLYLETVLQLLETVDARLRVRGKLRVAEDGVVFLVEDGCVSIQTPRQRVASDAARALRLGLSCI